MSELLCCLIVSSSNLGQKTGCIFVYLNVLHNKVQNVVVCFVSGDTGFKFRATYSLSRGGGGF